MSYFVQSALRILEFPAPVSIREQLANLGLLCITERCKEKSTQVKIFNKILQAINCTKFVEIANSCLKTKYGFKPESLILSSILILPSDMYKLIYGSRRGGLDWGRFCVELFMNKLRVVFCYDEQIFT